MQLGVAGMHAPPTQGKATRSICSKVLLSSVPTGRSPKYKKRELTGNANVFEENGSACFEENAIESVSGASCRAMNY